MAFYSFSVFVAEPIIHAAGHVEPLVFGAVAGLVVGATGPMNEVSNTTDRNGRTTLLALELTASATGSLYCNYNVQDVRRLHTGFKVDFQLDYVAGQVTFASPDPDTLMIERCVFVGALNVNVTDRNDVAAAGVAIKIAYLNADMEETDQTSFTGLNGIASFNLDLKLPAENLITITALVGDLEEVVAEDVNYYILSDGTDSATFNLKLHDFDSTILGSLDSPTELEVEI